ncbi:MAG: phage tail tape measure protein [Odoribacter sp.]
MANKNTVNRRVNLYINGKEAGRDIKSIRGEMQKLVNEQARMKIGSDEYIAHTKRIRELRGVIDEHNRQLKTVKNNWLSIGNLSDSFNRYFGMITAAAASLTGIVLGFKKLSQDVAKMDDIYSDVSKTTNLTRDQVVALNEQFKKMDTRTSREELNKLAADAGKLGISGQKNILDFVDAGNQIRVALGEDLGDDAIKNIGKITEVFKDSTIALQGMDLKNQMLSVGSAINELGQSSTASESYLVDFAQRLGGVASQAGISIQNILGYASALDQGGQKVEMSATSFQNFIMKLMEDPAKFARLAGEDVNKFTKLLSTDTNAAIIQVLTSLNSRGGFQALIPIFSEMGLDGARAVGVLSNLAGKINLVTDAQALSNKGFSEAISITNEYSKKNENLQAKLEKARKSFNDQALILGEKLAPSFIVTTNGFTYLIKALSGAPEFLKENRTLLISLTGALASYALYLSAAAIQTKIVSGATATLTGIKKAYNIITGETLLQKVREAASNDAMIASIEKLLTKEQLSILQKKNLSRENGDYAKSVQEMVNKNVDAAQAEVDSLVKETNGHKVARDAKLANKTAAQALVLERRKELVSAQLSGDATRISAAEKNLEIAVNKRNVASSAALSAQKSYEAGKTKLTTAATQNNTIASRIAEAQNEALAASSHIAGTATARLTLATKALWASLKTNPLGWILSLVGLAVTAYQAFSGRVEAATSAQDEFYLSLKKESTLVDILFNRLKKATKGTDEYNTAKKAIMDKYGIYLRQLGDENTALEDQVVARKAVMESIEAEMKAKVYAKYLEQYVTDATEAEMEAYKKIKSGLTDKLGKDRGNIVFDSLKNALNTGGDLSAIFKENGIDRYLSGANGFFSKSYNQWIFQIRKSKKELSDQMEELKSFYDPDKNLADKETTSPDDSLSSLKNEKKVIDDLIKSKEKELKLIQDQPARTKEEITARNLKVKALQDEISALKNLGISELESDKKAEKGLESTKEKKEKELAKAITDIWEKLRASGVTESEKEILLTRQKYATLLAMCKQYELDASEVYIAMAEEQRQTLEKQLSQLMEQQNTDEDKYTDDQEKIDKVLMSKFEKERADIINQYASLIALADTEEKKNELREKMNKAIDHSAKENEEEGRDILGMSPEDWDEMSEKVQIALDIAGQLTDIWGQFNQIQSNKEKKELQEYEKGCNKKKELLNKQLNFGKISQEKYNAQVSLLDADLEKKKTEMARKQAKRDKAIAITSTIINTASAVVKSLNTPPPFNYILAAITAAMGAAQLGVIMSQPLPEFATGGHTNGAKMYIAGESGTEWIAPNRMLDDPITGPIIQQLEMVRTGVLSPRALTPIVPDFQTMTSIPMYASGGMSSTSSSTTNNYFSESTTTQDSRIVAMLEKLTELCDYLSDPRNRQAVISNDLLQKNEKEMKTISRLKRL